MTNQERRRFVADLARIEGGDRKGRPEDPLMVDKTMLEAVRKKNPEGGGKQKNKIRPVSVEEKI